MIDEERQMLCTQICDQAQVYDTSSSYPNLEEEHETFKIGLTYDNNNSLELDEENYQLIDPVTPFNSQILKFQDKKHIISRNIDVLADREFESFFSLSKKVEKAIEHSTAY